MYDFTSPPHFKVLEDIPWLDARIFTAEGGHSLGTYAAPSGAPGLNCAVQGNDNHVAKEMNRGKVAHCFGFEPEKLLTTKEEEDTICIIRVPWNIHSRPRDNSLILSEMFDYVAGILEFGPGPTAHGSSEMPTWGPIFRFNDKQNERVVKQRIKNLSDYLASLQEH